MPRNGQPNTRDERTEEAKEAITLAVLSEHRKKLEAIVDEVACDLYFLDSLVGNGESDKSDPYRMLLDSVRTAVANQLGSVICERAERRLTEQPACLCMTERRERAKREALALDVFRNSTEHEEYRPS